VSARAALPQTPSRHRLLGAAVSLTAIVVGLGAWELFLRFRYHAHLAALIAENGLWCVEAAPERELAWQLVPGRCGANSRGFIDSEHPLAKPAGVFRIVVIGDSVAEGDGVAADEGFASLLERQLNESGARRYEVIKLARRGYATRQELYLLEHQAFAYAPDLILWSYVLNDPAETRYDHSFNQLSELYRPPLHIWHLVQTALFQARQRRALERCGNVDWRLRLHCDRWDEVTQRMARAAELARTHGVPVVFVLHPVLEKGRTFESYSFTALHAQLRALAVGQGWRVLDLVDAYRSYPPEELAQRQGDVWDDTHPNAKGHRLAAEAIKSLVLGEEAHAAP